VTHIRAAALGVAGTGCLGFGLFLSGMNHGIQRWHFQTIGNANLMINKRDLDKKHNLKSPVAETNN
jgi:hypothetical protein